MSRMDYIDLFINSLTQHLLGTELLVCVKLCAGLDFLKMTLNFSY